MPPAIYAAHRVSVVGVAFGQNIVNVFNAAGYGSSVDAAVGVGTAFAEAWKTILPTSYAFGYANAIDMHTAEGDTSTYSLTSFGTGAGTAATEVGLAAIISWQDTVSGRGFRNGRTYIGPLPASVLASGGLQLGPAYLSTFDAGAASFLANITTSGGTLVVVHGMNTANQQVAPVVEGHTRLNTAHLDSRRD